MWTCRKCAERLDDTFDACWGCGEYRDPVQSVSSTGTEDVGEQSELEIAGDVVEDVMELILEGRQGKTAIVSGDVIRIVKQGFFSGRNERTLLIRNISSVEVKKPGGFAGFIQFSIAGGAVRDRSRTLSGGAFDAVQDENSVVFNGDQKYQVAMQIKNYVESWSASPTRTTSGVGPCGPT